MGSVPSPLFIVGFPRSGTTLLRLMLDAHPDVCVPFDTRGVWARLAPPPRSPAPDPAAEHQLVARLLAEERIRLWGLDLPADEVLRHRRRPGYPGIVEAFYLAAMARDGKRRWADKDPGNMGRLPQLLEWFPDAQFVHLIRDPRDVWASHQEQPWGERWCARFARAWRERVGAVRRHSAALPPGRYVEVRYEALVTDPVVALQPLCAFLGIPWSPAMLDYPSRVDRAIPAVRREAWPLISEPPRADRAGRWRGVLAARTVAVLEHGASPLLTGLGYRPESRLPQAVAAALFWGDVIGGAPRAFARRRSALRNTLHDRATVLP